MPEKSGLVVSSLKPITLYSSNNLSLLKNKRVKKYGAMTGEREGKLVLPECRASIDPHDDSSIFGKMFAVVGIDKANKSFAEKGDSGAIVTIRLANTDRSTTKYALGIVVQIRHAFMGHNKATLCVNLDHCLQALQGSEGLAEKIDSTKLELYEGFLKPDAVLYDRVKAHIQK